ncbi:MAG: hypothetical protein JO227_15760 [Acetobacteraceae bacterium]|nr:hypothetical protein [Acetobacteraceae bacterium]
MPRRAGLALMLLTTTGAAASAEDRPLLQPTRDVMVEYHITNDAAAAHRVNALRIYATAQGARLRIEPDGQPGYSILDRPAHRMTVVMVKERRYIDLPLDPDKLALFELKDGTFTRRGMETIAGARCTVFDVTRQQHSGQVCVTDDGVLLRGTSDNPEHRGSLEATRVAYGPQPASLFVPPADFEKVDISAPPAGQSAPPPASRPR